MNNNAPAQAVFNLGNTRNAAIDDNEFSGCVPVVNLNNSDNFSFSGNKIEASSLEAFLGLTQDVPMTALRDLLNSAKDNGVASESALSGMSDYLDVAANITTVSAGVKSIYDSGLFGIILDFVSRLSS